ncbi:zinc finger X-chromosomal protein [Archocentrus centrarchus]|uniref:zinc finger X-chromosomal protein n=1 Tax=Archocentrus centrarchus TaxID=63155 RepID=UPI0011E9CAED|nr:zinc finger X-chromosomal protein-like [Archocentrus centrarchus]
MEATMFQLRLFIHQRLYGAAEEILGEVEKTITLALHEAQVYRSKDEAGSVRHQLAHLPKKSAAELPATNSTMEHGDKRDSPLLQENQGPPTPEESYLTVSNLSADLSNNSWNYCLVEMPEVKKEQEERGVESETPEIFVSPSEIVKSEEDRLEMLISHEMQPLSSDSSAAVSDEEMVNSRGGEQPKMVKENEKTLPGKPVGDNKKDQAALSSENCSVKGKKDRSFCHLCGKGFYYIAALKKHIKTHKKCTDCVLCGKKYKYKKELLRHLKTKHRKAFFCDVCGKTFPISVVSKRTRKHTWTWKSLCVKNVAELFTAGTISLCM